MLQSSGYNIHDTKYRYDLELEAQKTEINELHQDKANLQQRLNQTATLAGLFHTALVNNNITFNADDTQTIKTATQLEDPLSLLNPLPDNNTNPA